MTDVEMTQEDEEAPGPAVRGGLNPEASRLFRVYKTVLGMLEKRGYMIPRAIREMTPNEFVDKYGEYPSRETLTILVVSNSAAACKPIHASAYLIVACGLHSIL